MRTEAGDEFPDVPSGLDPHYADLGPFFDSQDAAHQLGHITRQTLSARRKTRSVLAMRAGDGTWIYPAWQFTGAGTIHRPRYRCCARSPPSTGRRRGTGWSAGTRT